jgi:hypothetical protein
MEGLKGMALNTETTPIAIRESAMKKVKTGGTSRSTAKARSGGDFRKTRWQPGLESLEVRQVPATFSVNTVLDTVAVNLQTGKDATGHISLRSAIMAANAQPGADTILLPNGLFKITIAGTGEDAAAKGDLDVRGDLTITGRGHTGTIIDGNSLDRVFQVLSGNVSLSQLTVQGGRSNIGGGLLNTGGRVTLSSVFVQSNLAIGADGAAGTNGAPFVPATNGQNGGEADGGGIANTSGSLTLIDSTVNNNSALGGSGGRGGAGAVGIGADGVPSTDFQARQGHDAGGGIGGIGGRGGLAQGGGVFNAPGASLTLSHSVVSDNTALGGVGGVGGQGGNAVGGRGADPLNFGLETEGFGGNGFGGAGGMGGAAGNASGGGLFNGGQVTLSGSENDFIENAVFGGGGGTGGLGGFGTGGRGGNGTQPGQGGSSAGGLGGFGFGGLAGVGAPGGAGLGGGVYNASGAVLTNSGPVGFSANSASGGKGGNGGDNGNNGGGGESGFGGSGFVALGTAGGIGGAGGHGGIGGIGEGGGLFNAAGARASFTAPATNSTRETVALFANNLAFGGLGGAGGSGGQGAGGFGGNGTFGNPVIIGQGGTGGAAEGGAGGAGGDGGLAAGGGFANAGNLSFTGITLNADSNQAVAGGNGSGGKGGAAFGGQGGNGDRGGNGGDAVSGNGGNAGNDGNAFGGGGYNAPSGVLFIDPRQGAQAGSAQSRARSLIRFNQAVHGSPSASGIARGVVAGTPGNNGGHFGTARTGNPGSPGLLGQDRGGGLYLSPGGTVTLRNTVVSLNQASTGDPDIFGTFSQ